MIINEFEEFINSINLDQNIELNDIPKLDLYMDQVIQLFENKFTDVTRNSKEKVLTKTMINNYSKDKLFMAVKNKKYSPEHMILLSLIYQLKGSLSISDIKLALSPMVDHLEKDPSYSAAQFYKLYLDIFKKDVETYKRTISSHTPELLDFFHTESKESLPNDFENNLLILVSLVTMSNLYRKTAERFIDDFIVKDKVK